jgi:hypothetical protein
LLGRGPQEQKFSSMIDEQTTANALQAKEAPRKRPGRSKFFRTAAGKRQAAQFSEAYSGRSQARNLGRTGPGKIEQSAAVSDWELVKCLGRGEIPEEMKTNAAQSRGRSLGLNYGTVFFCDQGEPFTDGELQALRGRCGFTCAAFEQLVGLPARSIDARHASMVRAPDIARAIVNWRDSVLRSLLQVANPAYKYERVLKTFLPGIRALYRLSVDRFTEIQKAMQAGGGKRIWTLSSLGNFVCEQAKQSAKQKTHAGPWGMFLRFLAELDDCAETKEFLEAKLKSLNRSKALAVFVRELLGQRYGTTHWTVNRALSPKLRVVPSAEMCGLILSPRPAVQPSRKGGRPARDIAPEADRLQREEKLSWLEIAQKLDPKTCKHSPDAAKEAIRQAVIRYRKRQTRAA